MKQTDETILLNWGIEEMLALALQNFGERIDLQLERIERLESELSALATEQRRLWIAADVDAQDVTNELDTVSARLAENEDLLERAQLGLAELYRRRDAASDEIALVHHRQNCAEMERLNELGPKLERAYRKAAATYFDSLAALLGNVAAQRTLSQQIDAVAYDRPGVPSVAPVLPGVRVAVECEALLDSYETFDGVHVAISISGSRFGGTVATARDAILIERLARWHK